jgi:hypothetical protein
MCKILVPWWYLLILIKVMCTWTDKLLITQEAQKHVELFPVQNMLLPPFCHECFHIWWFLIFTAKLCDIFAWSCLWFPFMRCEFYIQFLLHEALMKKNRMDYLGRGVTRFVHNSGNLTVSEKLLEDPSFHTESSGSIFHKLVSVSW